MVIRQKQALKLARWEYGYIPEAGSQEAELYERYLLRMLLARVEIA